MPKVNKQIARADIYQSGLKTKADNKQGYTLDRSKPANENDKVIVKKGQEYYSWAFRYGGSHISLTYPKPRQLTQSDFMIQLYDIQDDIDSIEAEDVEQLEGARDELVGRIESLQSETQDKLDNMPEQLQYSPTGELLQERIDACDSWYSELNVIDLDYDELEDSDIADELDIETAPENWTAEEKELIETTKYEKLREWLDEKIEEIQNCTCPLKKILWLRKD